MDPNSASKAADDLAAALGAPRRSSSNEDSSQNGKLQGESKQLSPHAQIVARLSTEERRDLERRLVRKIDWRLLPPMVIIYILNNIDRNNIGATKLSGLPQDLHLHGNQFQVTVSILFIGYLLMEVPSNLYLNKIGLPGVYLPICMALWGVISASTAAVTNYGGLLAARFFLGFVEAGFFPGALYYLSCWYTRKELGLRISLLYSGSLISGAFSGLIAAGVNANLTGKKGYAAWQWLFILEGVITIFVALISIPILPNFPRTTKWLSEEERALATLRLEEDVGDDDWIAEEQHQTMWEGTKLAFADPKTYVMILLGIGIVTCAGIAAFFPVVVATLGFDNVISLLLTSPPYCLAVVTTSLLAWNADRTGERFWHVVLPLCVALIGFIVAAATTTVGPRYFAMVIIIPGIFGGLVVALAWITNTMIRPPAKRAAALAFINAVANVTGVYVSFLYQDFMAPRFVDAFVVNSVMIVLAIASALALRMMLVRLNKKLEQGIYVEGAVNKPDRAFRFNI